MSEANQEAKHQHDECCGHHHHHQKTTNKQQAASLNINAKPFSFSESSTTNTTTSEQQQGTRKKPSRKPFNKVPSNTNNNNNNGQSESSSSGNVNENNNNQHSQEQKPFKKPFARKPNQQVNVAESNQQQQPMEGQESNPSSTTKPRRNNKPAFKKSSEATTTSSSTTTTDSNNASASSSNNTTSVNNNRPPRSARKPKPFNNNPTTPMMNNQQQEEGNISANTPILQQESSSTEAGAASKRRQKFQNHPHAKTFVKPIVADDNSDTLSTTASDVSNSTATSASSSSKKPKKKKNNKPKGENQPSETQQKDPKKKNKKKHHDNDEDMFWSHSYSNAGAFSTKTTRTVYDKLKAAKLSEEEVEALPLQDKIMYLLTKQTYDCMVCSDNILRQHHTWSCTDCYRVFHLQCIKRWVSEKVEKEDRNHWKCPACNSAKIVNIPTDYLCFCGKISNPKVDLEVIPHSCGGVCGKVRSCPHPCTDFCHPGPCKECDLTRDVKCYCGKETFYSIKCNDPNYKNGASCGRVCGKLLSCRKHTCPNPCHQGPCEPCKEVINVECYCGHSNLQQVSCNTYSHMNTSIAHREYNLFDIKKGEDDSTIYRTYSCNQTCKKLLPCGQHYCDRVCHYGKCIGHKISQWVKTTSQEEEEGIDEYIKKAGCYQQCRSILKCGHFCTLKCHPNQIKCMKCNAQVEVYCKCGRKFEKRTCDGKSREESDVVFLDCDEECRKIQRVKQLADAFQIDYDKFELPEYTNELSDFARRSLHIIKNWEFEFDVLLTSDNKRASKQFTPMKRERRALLHELAEHYKFTSVSVDAEPNRSVIVTLGNQSKRPSILLSEVVTDPEKLRKLKEKIVEQEEKERKEEIKRYRKFKSTTQSTSPVDDEDEWISVKGKSSYQHYHQQEEEEEDVLSKIVHAGNNSKNIKAQDVDKKLFANSFGSLKEQKDDNHQESKEAQEPVNVGDTLNWGNEMEDEDSKVLEESL